MSKSGRKPRNGNGAQNKVVSVEIVRPFALDTLDLRIAQTRLNRTDRTQRDFVLKGQNIVELAVVAFRPKMNAGFGLDELRADPDALARLTYTTFQYVAHTQLATDPLHVHSLSLESEAGIARDNEQPFDARETGDDLLHHTVGKVFLLRIAAQVLDALLDRIEEKQKVEDQIPLSTNATSLEFLRPSIAIQLSLCNAECELLLRHCRLNILS